MTNNFQENVSRETFSLETWEEINLGYTTENGRKKGFWVGCERATWGFIGAVEKIGERSASLAQFAEAAFMTESEG